MRRAHTTHLPSLCILLHFNSTLGVWQIWVIVKGRWRCERTCQGVTDPFKERNEDAYKVSANPLKGQAVVQRPHSQTLAAVVPVNPNSSTATWLRLRRWTAGNTAWQARRRDGINQWPVAGAYLNSSEYSRDDKWWTFRWAAKYLKQDKVNCWQQKGITAGVWVSFARGGIERLNRLIPFF